MARVFYNGDFIYVDPSRLDINKLKELAKEYNAQYSEEYNMYAFPKKMKCVLDISELTNAIFDKTFEELSKKVKAAVKHREEEKQAEIDSLGLPEIMYPFQKEAVAQMLKMRRNILLASEQGCGKTCMSSVYLGKSKNYPALIVCPASLKTNWEVEIHKWTPDVKTYVISGRDSYENLYVVESAKQADVIIINYDILGIDDKEASRREKERIAKAKKEGKPYRKAFVPVKGWVNVFNKEFHIKCLCLDECQYIESEKAIRTRAVIQIAVNERIKKLFCSGTPFETRVAQFYVACHLLAPDLFPKEWDFKQRYCNPYYNGFGWTYKGVSNLEELRSLLSTFMIRHKKEDVLKQLPPKQKIPIYFDMDKNARKIYDQMEMELAEQEDAIHQFAYLAKMKEALVDIKVEPVIQFIKDMLEVEDKVVIFTFHDRMYQEIIATFGKQCVGINGSTPSEKRQGIVDAFQIDENVKVFVGQIKAASTGITLTASHTVIFTEWGQTPAQHNQAVDRIHRIGQEADRCLIYYLIVKDTVDEDPLTTLSEHNADIEAVMDGNTDSKFVDYDSLMIAKVKERRLMKNKKGVQIEYE